jgi:acetaldehyde dehydrogenase (acetylating)
MIIRKTLIAVLALAIAIAFSPLTSLQAATFAGPGTKVSADTLTQTVAAKKSMKKKGGKRKGKRAKSKGPGHCGTMMYWSKKGRKCMDATKK